MPLLLSCGSGKTSSGDNPAKALIRELEESVESGVVLYGHQDDLFYGHSWKVVDYDLLTDDLSRSDVKSVTGKFPAVIGVDLGGIELGSPRNLDGVPFDLMRRAIVKHSAAGGAVTASWHSRNPLTGGDAWDVSSDCVVESILPGGKKHSEFMTWLSRVADFIGSLKDDEGKPVPVIFRPWHENIGSWFWWGGKLCSEDQYIALYRMTWEYMTVTRGLDNIVWAYSPNSMVSADEYISRYPGDEYVDILGIDHYQGSGSSIEEENRHFSDELKRCLAFMSDLASAHGKLMALTETGLEGLPCGDWWTCVLYPAIKDAPIAYLLTWRNAWDKPGHFYAPWPGQVSADNFAAFSSLTRIKLLDKNE